MSTRREFAKTAVGALFGISVVPEFGTKPQFRPCLHDPIYVSKFVWPPLLELMDFDPQTIFPDWEDRTPQDITIAQKIALKDRFS
jgi:hypothetical protein